MTYIEKSGKTVDAAIEAALDELGVSRSSVDVEILEAPSKGFFGLGGREARVKVTLVRSALEEVEAAYAEIQRPKTQLRKTEPLKAAPQQARIQPKAAPQKSAPVRAESRPQPPRREEQKTQPSEKAVEKAAVVVDAGVDNGIDAADEARKFLQGLFLAMKLKDIVIERLSGDDGYVRLNVLGKDLGVLIGKHGYNLEAIQYLVNMIANRDAGIKKRFIVDIEGYRVRRAATLTRLAMSMANKVKRAGKPMAFEPMSPHERKVIHSALQRDRFVTTHSEGEEPHRKIVVSPKNPRPFGNRPPFNKNNTSKPNFNKRPPNKRVEQ